MSEHRACRNCDNVLLPDEDEPCADCKPYVDIVGGLLIPKNQVQSLSDFYRDERDEFGGGPDIVSRPFGTPERVNR